MTWSSKHRKPPIGKKTHRAGMIGPCHVMYLQPPYPRVELEGFSEREDVGCDEER
jgi:hypothetical protein